MNKAVNVLNFFSYILFAGVLLLVYAYLPISVKVNIADFPALHKQTFFYYAFGVFFVMNLILRGTLSVLTKRMVYSLASWTKLLIMVVNVYLTMLIGFLGIYNNQQAVSTSSYSYLTYVGPVILILWLIGLIICIFKSMYLNRSKTTI